MLNDRSYLHLSVEGFGVRDKAHQPGCHSACGRHKQSTDKKKRKEKKNGLMSSTT